MVSLEGALIGGRFEVRERIGAGGMSTVHRAHDRELGVDVAVKVARPTPAAAARLASETRALRRLKSEHVSRFLAAGQHGDATYLVLELIEGETLAARVERVGPLPLGDVDAVTTPIFAALVDAHRAGIVHRDVTPANILLPEAGGAKLIDFGLGKDPADVTQTKRGAIVGSPAFAAPEQLSPASRADHRVDQYGLAGALVYALTGRAPFGEITGKHLTTLKRERDAPTLDELTGVPWPPPLVAVLARMLACAPRQRFASIEVARAAFRHAVALVSGAAPRITGAPPQRERTVTVRGWG